MQVTFSSSYLSINSFPTIDLPDFCVLTGLNGVGKTHFLQALQNGNLRVDCAPNQSPGNQNEVRFFDWNSLVPQDTGVFLSENLKNEKVDAFNQYNSHRNQFHIMEMIRNVVRQQQLPTQYVSDPISATSLSLEDITSLGIGNDPRSVHEQIRQAAIQSQDQILGSIGEPVRSRIRAIAGMSGKPFLTLSQDDFFRSSATSWGEVSIFQQSFARLFVAYRDANFANQIGQFMASKGEKEVKYISDEEFVRQNGPPPWQFVNESLAAAGLDFQINHPALNETSPFQPELKKITNATTIQFGALSSGEKVLMSFAFCIYYSQDRRQLALHPKLILLDEVDAPLHPSMSRTLIGTIQKTLVEAYGIKVILTTHSPSTVAMAPEDSIYVMKPNEPGLHKSSRAEALNILTVGVPTLAISYEGRRQVFVESPSDAKIYDAIYKLIRPRIASERSLEFIATGTRSATGAERNTGCDVVKRIVSDLSAAGNQSVFGLVDWDGHHQGSARMAVLAEGNRNGLENLILDPLIISLLICRDFPAQKPTIGILSTTNFISYSQLDPQLTQAAVDLVTTGVLGSSATETVRVEYTGGLSLQVDKRYLTTDDHGLEALLEAAFPFLRAISRNQSGKLTQHVVATVLTDVPSAIPVELLDIMHDILERPSH